MRWNCEEAVFQLDENSCLSTRASQASALTMAGSGSARASVHVPHVAVVSTRQKISVENVRMAVFR